MLYILEDNVALLLKFNCYFVVTCRFHLQAGKISRSGNQLEAGSTQELWLPPELTVVSCLAYISILTPKRRLTVNLLHSRRKYSFSVLVCFHSCTVIRYRLLYSENYGSDYRKKCINADIGEVVSSCRIVNHGTSWLSTYTSMSENLIQSYAIRLTCELMNLFFKLREY
jgi:hypothetical protein